MNFKKFLFIGLLALKINGALAYERNHSLQISITENSCVKTINEPCFFSDKFFSEPYFHETILTIFSNKIFATQFYSDKIIYKQVKDGLHFFEIEGGGEISFATHNGVFSNLNFTSKNLTKKISKCEMAENLYNFYKAYNADHQLNTRSDDYEDEYDFNGINHLVLFSEKENQSQIFSLIRNSAKITTRSENLRLCKKPNDDILKVKHLDLQECKNSNDAEECQKYKDCEDIIVIEDCEILLFKEGV